MNWDAYGFLKLSDTSLHLQESCVGRVRVIVEHIDLPVQLRVRLVLVTTRSLNLPGKLVLLIQRVVFVLDDVHLKDGTSGVFLCLDDLYLAPVVLDLTHDVDQDVLESLKLPSERHRLFVLQAKHGL